MRTLDIVITPQDRPGAFRPNQKASPQPAAAKQPKAKARKTRRAFRGPLLTPVQKAAALGVAGVAVIMTLIVIWHSGWPQRTLRDAYDSVMDATASIGFRVNDITVTGRDRTPPSAILSALGAGRDHPILDVDLGDAKARLEEIPSVQSATVERRLPNTLRVALVERRPVALWQHDGAFMLVDKDGHQFPGTIDGYQGLPLIVGEGAPSASAELFAFVAQEPGLAPRIKAAIRVSNRRWNLRLDDAEHGLEARLPETDIPAALHQLAELEKNHSLTSRHVEMVDLRMTDRMVVKTGTEQTANSPSTHKEGG